ncbi:MAG: RluA family pseudouridine synthase [Clostridiales bacterium]|nr:RluA family pseudouridine synthase [Clostridiales bacterium]
MQRSTVDTKNAGKRIDKYLQESYPGLSFSLLLKTFRKRDVKVNGTRVQQDYKLEPGDIVEIFLTDELLCMGISEKSTDTPSNALPAKEMDVKNARMFDVVYEDDNIILVNKFQGISVHADREGDSATLIDNVSEYLGYKAMLCHRLDRNTGGLVVIAKNAESHDIIVECMSRGEIRKYYQCLVKGELEKKTSTLKAWLEKEEHISRVFVSDEKKRGSLEIITKYKVLEYEGDADISRLEIELVTGRTHQIRAHMASIGHPVIGDGKYGKNSVNRPLKMKQQALWACRLEMNLTAAGRLNYLKGRSFEVEPGFPSISELGGRLLS